MRVSFGLAVVALGGLLGSASAAYAQEPVITDYRIFPTKVTGQTCLENQDNKEIKCAVLMDKSAGFVPVAELEIRSYRHRSRDVMIQYCAKVEDTDFEGFECQATVDGTVASPGATKPLEQVTGTNADHETTGVTIYNFCLSWFGEAEGKGKHQIEVQCEFKDENTAVAGEVRFDSSTTTVLSR
ncbi:MAG: hypothetical protein AAF637_10120 [Pseudomonadota bacterium]